MKIITWNIGGGYILGENPEVYDIEDLGYLAQEMAKESADIACLQEVHISKTRNQAQEIGKKAGLSHTAFDIVSPSHLTDGENISLAVISKFPILSQKFHLVSNPNLEFIWKGQNSLSHDKGILETCIEVQGQKIRVFSTHMVPYRKFWRNFLEDDFLHIRNEIQDIILQENSACIVCGDFNFNENIKDLFPRLFAQGFQSLVPAGPTSPRGRSYDKILVSSHFTCTKSQIHHGKADHYMCSAEIIL